MDTPRCTEHECKKLYTGVDKLKVAVLGGILFLLLSLPIVHEFISDFVKPMGFNMQADDGCLSVAGIVVMAIIFTLVTRILMF